MSTKLLNLINKGLIAKDALLARELLKKSEYTRLKNLVKSEILTIERRTAKSIDEANIEQYQPLLNRLPYLDLLAAELDIFIMDDMEELYSNDYD